MANIWFKTGYCSQCKKYKNVAVYGTEKGAVQKKFKQQPNRQEIQSDNCFTSPLVKGFQLRLQIQMQNFAGKGKMMGEYVLISWDKTSKREQTLRGELRECYWKKNDTSDLNK